MSLQALARSLRQRGHVATCYVCGDEQIHQGASFVADIGERHTVRFLVSDCGISWVECRDGCELVRFEGADAIHELQRLVILMQEQGTAVPHQPSPEPIATEPADRVAAAPLPARRRGSRRASPRIA